MSGVDVVTLGETMGSFRAAASFRLGGPISMSMAGAESNVAIGLARLGHSVRWGGRLGNDEVGAFILRTLRAEAVNVETVEIDDARPTGILLVERRIAEISRVNYYRSGSAGSALSAANASAALAGGARILHLSGITPALSDSAADAAVEAVRLARQAGALVSVDVNYRSRLWSAEEARPVLSALVRTADIVIASEDELGLVVATPADEAAAAAELAESGVGRLIVKRGARGASLWMGGEVHHAPAIAITVQDTIGAGDAFTAGYLSGVLEGLSAPAALHRGTVAGAFAVATLGDWEGLPTREELVLVDNESGSTLR